jgi:aromatic-L-amino-acid/L-tryptophan decarboxylase
MKEVKKQEEAETIEQRAAQFDMDSEEFRVLGRELVDRIAGFLASIRERPVAPAQSIAAVREALQADRPLPVKGTDAQSVIDRSAGLLFEHSLLNGHPRFLGYVTSSAAPLGALAELLAASVNANLGSWTLAPVATEIEVQTVRWIAELIGYPVDCGGLLVSGGNMANFVGFLAARRAHCGEAVRKGGLAHFEGRLRVYASSETHTWIHKAADMFGIGTDSIVWIPADDRQHMRPDILRGEIEADLERGLEPFLVIGNAGSVMTGAVDPLEELAAVSRDYGLWFHVDGAYGAVAAGVPGAPPELRGLQFADSIAIDPHKWLYAPLEAGCALVRKRGSLLDTFSYHPPYYLFDEEATNYFDLGPQNSRGFRALKVWMMLQQAGRDGMRQMIRDDILLARRFYEELKDERELEPLTHTLSITTFRYVPADLKAGAETSEVCEYLDDLNREIQRRIELSGDAFVSSALIRGKFALRLCIVNFRTSWSDLKTLARIAQQIGHEVDTERRGPSLSVSALTKDER